MKPWIKKAARPFAIAWMLLLLISVPSLAAANSFSEFAPDDSLEQIREKIQDNGYSFTVSDNWVFRLPQEERNRLHSRRPSDPARRRKTSQDLGPLQRKLGQPLPAAFDWRDKDGRAYIGPIRDQGQCGSCYAFGAMAAAEGTYNAAMDQFDGAAADFSEAFLAFCLSDHYSWNFGGCDGADYEYMELQALVDYGTTDESVFPYEDEEQDCPLDPYPPLVRFLSWHRIGCQDIDAIKTAIMTYGVVDAAVLATSAFDAYESGVYEDQNTTCDDPEACYYAPTNHAIALVGWDDNPPEGGGGCWILRNSWGDSWGESGYMRIRYTSAAVSCAVTYLVYAEKGPTVETSGPTGVTATGATLNGSVNPRGMETEYSFEYGPSLEMENATPTASAGTGNENLAVTAVLAGLTPRTTYYHRLIAENAEALKTGAILSFVTGGGPMAPGAQTDEAGVDFNSVRLAGRVNPHGEAASCYFEYGKDEQYGTSTEVQDLEPGTEEVEVFQDIGPLDWSTQYHYRIVAANSVSTTFGADMVLDIGPAPDPPLVQALPASPVGATGAVLNALVNPNDPAAKTTCYFEYGETDAYGQTTDDIPLGAGLEDVPASAVLTGLAPRTAYHYRAAASNPAGTVHGPDQTFTTGQALFHEDFDREGLPPHGWTQEMTYGATQWVFSEGNVDNPNGYAALFCTDDGGGTTILALPPINLSGAVSPTLEFRAGLDAYDPECTLLAVYYKTSESGEWQVLQDYDGSTLADGSAVLNLPEPSSAYFIGVEGDSYCYGCMALYEVGVSALSWGEGAPVMGSGVISDVTYSSAIVSSEVISDSGHPITSRGFCWSGGLSPTLEDNVVQAEGQVGVFAGTLAGLPANTRLHARAFATNAMGTAYGLDLEFLTPSLPAPEAHAAENVGANQFTAHWSAVEGATGYYIDVWKAPSPLEARRQAPTRKSAATAITEGPGVITVEFTFDPKTASYAPDAGYLKVFLEGGVLPGDRPGLPQLPVQFANIMIPSGADVRNIQVSADEQLVRSQALVYPAQPAASPSLPAPDFAAPDPAAYASQEKFPAMPASMEAVQIMGGASFVSVRLNPVRCVPAARELYFASRILVTIEFDQARKSAMPGEPLLLEAVNSLVVNPVQAPARKDLHGPGSVDYLIITTEALSASFQALLDQRTTHSGLSCEIKTVEDIDSAYLGLDVQYKIRNCIKDYVSQHNTVFVVLGGDDTVIPARICPIAYAYNIEETPTDLYYSGLDGDWDANGNEIFGEPDDGADLAPDVFVGRIPVQTPEQAGVYINKLISFETDPVAWAAPTMIFSGTTLWDAYRDEDRPSDLLDDGHLEFQDPEHTVVSDAEMWTRRMLRDVIRPLREPAAMGMLFDTLTSWDASEAGDYVISPGTVNAQWNQGWTHLFYSGHGNETAWSLENWDRYSPDDALALDGVLGFVYTTACLSNAFDYYSDPCLSEGFIRNGHGGAINFVGSSRYGWGDSDPGPANQDSEGGGSDHFARQFYKRLLETDAISSGEAFALHKADLAAMSNPGSVHQWLQYSLNLMGDPAVMWGGSFVDGYHRLHVGDVISFTVTGLDSNSIYYYRVSSEDGTSLRNNSDSMEVATAAMDILLDNTFVVENLPAGSLVGALSTPDADSPHAFTLASGTGDDDNGLFAIDGNSLKTAAMFDYESRNAYSIRVQTNDGAQGVYEKVFFISVENAAEADIALAKDVDNPAPPVGGQIVYTITALNYGPDPGENIVIQDLLPNSLTYVNGSAQGGYDPASGAWTLGSLGVGATSVMTLTVTVTQPGAITNTAVLSSTVSLDYEAANNQALAVLHTDSDQDGLSDDLESAWCTNPNDRDSDDDGLEDGVEDANHNGVVDPGETSPCNADSDHDGVQDGVELGLTLDDIGQDTDLGKFQPDLDPASVTDPLNPDSDDDGWLDGEEDANHNGRVDEGEGDPRDPATPLATPPAALQTLPRDRAGLDDAQRIANNTCFAVLLEDQDGIDATDAQAVIFSVEDGVNGAYERNLGDADVVRTVSLTEDPEDRITSLWVVYDRAGETILDAVYPFGATVAVTVQARDIRDDDSQPAAFAFKVETQEAHDNAQASLPAFEALDPGDPSLGGAYDAGVQATGDGIAGARIVYDSSCPVIPGFGPTGEAPALSLDETQAVGAPLNLQPPAVFSTPVKVFVPCTGKGEASGLTLYLFDGARWAAACNPSGQVLPGGEGWMVPGSRVNHDDADPPLIEIKVHHFTGVQAGVAASNPRQDAKDSDNCFIRALKHR